MDKDCKEIILNALNEDLLPNGDITSECLFPKGLNGTFQLIVNENAILSGIDVLKKTFELLDKNIIVKNFLNDGDEINKSQVIAEIYGETLSVLKGERTALNFVSHLSGISTLTRKLVSLIKNTNVVLLDTRKTTPGLRLLEKKAVTHGGGKNHRFNLSEMVLIKDNHIDECGGVTKAIKKIKEKYRNSYKIEIEVRNLNELKEAIASCVDVIMFDNWNLKDLKEALTLLPPDIKAEASGLINESNIKEYASTGVDYISTSYMIKNARWIDFSLESVGTDLASAKKINSMETVL